MPEADQVATWLELFRRRFDDARYRAARERALESVSVVMPLTSSEAWLRREGIEVCSSMAPVTFGTATVRARFHLDVRRVIVYDAPLDAMVTLFEPLEVDRDTLRAAIIGHEAFHVIDPCCPEALAETAAHFFAGRTSGLGCFGGVLDVMQSVATVGSGSMHLTPRVAE